MIKVNVSKSSRTPISAPKIKKTVKVFLKNRGIVSDCIVDVSVVNKKTMLSLAKKFLKENNVLHDVLSFTENEKRGGFKYGQSDVIYLGEVVLCYEKIVEEASSEGVLIEEKVKELVEHGCLHLLGTHH